MNELTDQPPVHAVESDRDRRRHEASLAVEMRKLERNLRELGPMPCERLADLTHADRWREGTFGEAVALGVREGCLERMPFDWLKATRGPWP